MASSVPTPDPQERLSSLNHSLFIKLCTGLDSNDKWRKLAEAVSQLLKNRVHFPLLDYERKPSPAKAFLSDLCALNLSIGALNALLEKCCLFDELLIINGEDELVLEQDLSVETSEVERNQTVTLSCSFRGLPPPSFRWLFNAEELKDQNKSTLIIPEFGEENVGNYYCEATQKLRDRTVVLSTTQIFLTLKLRAPVILVEPNEARAAPRTSAKFECKAIGWPKVSYYWFRDDEPLLETNAAHGVLEIASVTPECEGSYWCEVVNDQGVARSRQALLKITTHASPVILEHPELPNNEPVFVGTTLLLQCGAQGEPPLQFQWFCNGKPIEDQNDSTLRFEVQPVDGSTKLTLKCRVANVHGHADSRPVKVTVDTSVKRKQYTATRKVALMIGNSHYDHSSSLGKPLADVSTLSKELEKLDFRVISLCNLNLLEVRNAIRLLARFVIPGSYVVVYLAGHGFHLNGDDYFLPVDAPEENFTRSDSVSISEIIETIQPRDPSLLLLLVDTCRVVPSPEGNPLLYAEKQVSVASQPRPNLAIGFATSERLRAYELSLDANGIYMSHLKEFICSSIPVVDMLRRARQKLDMMNPIKGSQLPMDHIYLVEDVSLGDPVDQRLVGQADWNNMEVAWRKLQELPESDSAFQRSGMRFFVVDIDEQKALLKVQFRKHQDCFFNALHVSIGVSCRRVLDLNFRLEPGSLKYSITRTQDMDHQIHCDVVIGNVQVLQHEDALLNILVKDQTIAVPLGKPLIAKTGVLSTNIL